MHAVSGSTGAMRANARTGYRVIWGVLPGVGLTSSLVAAVMFGPADRKNRFIDPELASTLALVAGAIAIVLLIATLLLRVPDHQSARVGEVLSVTVGLICAGMLVFRGIAGPDDDRDFTSGDVTRWLPLAVVSALLVIGIAIRCDIARRATVRDPLG